MKILHIVGGMGSGGAEKMIQMLLPKIKEDKETEITLLILSNSNNVLLDSMEKDNIVVKVIDSKSPKSLKSFIELGKFLKHNKFDIIHSHLFPTLYFTAFYKKTLGILNHTKVVYTEHSSNNSRRVKILKRFEKMIYSNYDCIFAVSDEVGSSLKKWVGETSKIEVVYNGVDLSLIENAPKVNLQMLLKDNVDTKYITMVSRFSKIKDHETVVDALELLDVDYKVIFIGTGDTLSDIQSYVDNKNLSDRVYFLGFRNDVYSILKSSNITILSSKWEGLSIVSLESLASGIPFFATEVPGLEEIVRGYGVLFPLGDFKSLANDISDIMADINKYNELSNLGVQRAKDYSIQRTTKKHIDIYRRLLDEN